MAAGLYHAAVRGRSTDGLNNPREIKRGIVKRFGWNDRGITELIDGILLIALVVIMAGVIMVLAMDLLVPVEKTAYSAPQFGTQSVDGKTILTVFKRGGDPISFDPEKPAKYRALAYVDTSFGSFLAQPEPDITIYNPGDTLYLWYTGSGFMMAKTRPDAASVVALPGGRVAVRFVDRTSGTLIVGATVIGGPAATGTPVVTTPTTTGSPTPTATATTTVTTTVTTATPTATATTPSGTYTVTVSWSPPGIGTITPPGTSGGTVPIAAGASQMFTIAPNKNKRVISIALDGVQVGGPGVLSETLTYTLTNVQSNHSLTAVFGN